VNMECLGRHDSIGSRRKYSRIYVCVWPATETRFNRIPRRSGNGWRSKFPPSGPLSEIATVGEHQGTGAQNQMNARRYNFR
jgi:hypothetical protein